MPSQSNIVMTYIILVFIWASTPLAIVWSVQDLHLMWALVLRFFIALPVAAALLWLLNIKFPFGRVAVYSYAAGALSLIGSQIFTYMATAYLSSGMIALMFGLAPIMAGLIGRFAFGHKLLGLQWLGMMVSLIGLALICLRAGGQHIQLTGIVLMLASVFVYSLSIFWVKKINADVAPMAQATGSILISTLAAICLLPLIWQYAPTHMPETRSLLALIYTIVMASLIAMFCYFKLVQNIQPTTLSLTTVMTPMLAMFLGSWLNHERLTFSVIIGVVFLLSGLFLYFYRDFKSSRELARRQSTL